MINHASYIISGLILLSANCSFGQKDSLFIKIHFLYGSKPEKEFKHVENKWFGGIHGGHVSIEIGDSIYGFVPSGGFHVFPKKNNRKSNFTIDLPERWARDTTNMKYTSFIIPVDSMTYAEIYRTNQAYIKRTPYDYAFFGMRCAAATGDILGKHGFIKKRGRFRNTCKFFYPKRLRKKLFKIAEDKTWIVVSHEGSARRKWEKD